MLAGADDYLSKPFSPVLASRRQSFAVGSEHQVSLELRTGITGLVGANGAGKSTLRNG